MCIFNTTAARVGQRLSGSALSGTRSTVANLRRREMHLPSKKGWERAVLWICIRPIGGKPCVEVTMMTPMETMAKISAASRVEKLGRSPWTFTRRCLENWKNLLTLTQRPCSHINDHSDDGPHYLILEGLSDKWVGRGVRNACGLRLARDAEEEREGAQERQEEEKGYDDDSEDDDSEYGF
ncbi:hypothetical protein EDB19DRAFT_2029566 [Suillus lakei]|nr:hypothetical protein EDB19DRAFT_2029566 [Suillus lakei]